MSHPISRRALFGRALPRHKTAESTLPHVAVLGDGCLAVRGVTCGTCADPCDPRALKVRPLLGGRGLPTIDAAACTGCGECLNVCPVGALSLAPAVLGETTPCA